jgi:hypothetical protein
MANCTNFLPKKGGLLCNMTARPGTPAAIVKFLTSAAKKKGTISRATLAPSTHAFKGSRVVFGLLIYKAVDRLTDTCVSHLYGSAVLRRVT